MACIAQCHGDSDSDSNNNAAAFHPQDKLHFINVGREDLVYAEHRPWCVLAHVLQTRTDVQ